MLYTYTFTHRPDSYLLGMLVSSLPNPENHYVCIDDSGLVPHVEKYLIEKKVSIFTRKYNSISDNTTNGLGYSGFKGHWNCIEILKEKINFQPEDILLHLDSDTYLMNDKAIVEANKIKFYGGHTKGTLKWSYSEFEHHSGCCVGIKGFVYEKFKEQNLEMLSSDLEKYNTHCVCNDLLLCALASTMGESHFFDLYSSGEYEDTHVDFIHVQKFGKREYAQNVFLQRVPYDTQ